MPRITQTLSPTVLNKNDSKQALDSCSFEDVRILRTISKGNFLVFQIYNPEDRQHYCMKVFPDTKTLKPSTIFTTSLRFTHLSHPNIIKHYGTVHHSTKILQSKSVSYQVYELALAGDFYSALPFLTNFKSREKLVRTYFRQLVSAVEYMHSKGVYHLDLKLANLVLGKGYQLKVIDFDTSYLKGDLVVLSYGSKNYRAPEVIQKAVRILEAPDLYSIGVILFALMTGSLPYNEDYLVDGVDLWSCMFENLDCFWSFHQKSQLDEFSKEFKELFIGLTKKNPKDRMKLSEVKLSQFYNGEVYGDDELEQVMSKLLSAQ